MKIVYEGFYGFQNTGDDAFVEVAAWGAQKYWGCKNNVFIGKVLPKTITKINSRHVFPGSKGFDRLNFLYQLTDADYLISAGGSTFSEIPYHSNKNLSKNLKKINKTLKLGAIGVSIGPFKNNKSEKEVLSYLKSLDFVSVRDKRSFEYLNSLKLPYTPVNSFDLAALLPSVFNHTCFQKKENNNIIGISICNHESYLGGNLSKEKKRNIFYKELLELLEKNTNVHFKVFIINGNKSIGDIEVTNELMKDIDKNRISIVPYLNDVSKTWKEINECNLMISTRLHASIFACYSNIPFFLIEYHKKCSDFLNDVGQHTSYRIYDAEISPKEVFFKITKILKGTYIKPKFIKETIELSQKNFTSHKIR